MPKVLLLLFQSQVCDPMIDVANHKISGISLSQLGDFILKRGEQVMEISRTLSDDMRESLAKTHVTTVVQLVGNTRLQFSYEIGHSKQQLH